MNPLEKTVAIAFADGDPPSPDHDRMFFYSVDLVYSDHERPVDPDKIIRGEGIHQVCHIHPGQQLSSDCVKDDIMTLFFHIQQRPGIQSMDSGAAFYEQFP